MKDVVKTIDILQTMLSELDGERFIAMRTAIDAVMQVRAFEEADSGRWIDAETKDPEKPGEYLVTLGNGYRAVAVWSEIGQGWLVFNGDVIAWQTLPEPYNRKEKR